MKVVDWMNSHLELVIYLTVGLWSALLSAAANNKLPARLAALVQIPHALGLDAPKLASLMRTIFTGKPPAPPPPSSPKPPVVPEAGSEPPTRPDTPDALRKSGLLSMRCVTVFAASLACASITGCGLLHAAVPVISEIVAVVSDAQEILAIIDAAAQLFFAQHPELADARAKYTAIMSKVHVSLDAAIRTMRGATELEQNKVDEAFANFRVAYGDLLALVESLGLTHGGKFAAGPRAGEAIPQPLAITYRVAK